jgi:hypothetical protein
VPNFDRLETWELARFDQGQAALREDQRIMFASDGGLGTRLLAYSAMLQAESKLYTAFVALLERWASRVKKLVFGGQVPDISTMAAATPWFAQSVDTLVHIEIREVLDDAAHDYVDEGDPLANLRVNSYLAKARNRLVGIPDRVYADVRHEVMKATTEGMSIDDLSEKIHAILADEGAAMWRNRARTIARTEAVGAYNAGRFAGFWSYANQLGGSWEKVWLETHDHRTRLTHQEREGGVGGQRIPLGRLFKVGVGLGMYPGDPELPPEEVINCRCSILLVREGEPLDLSNRQYRRPQ